MSKVAILGTGAWGTALANTLLANNHDVAMWGIDEKEISDLKKSINCKYFGKAKLVKKLALVCMDIKMIVDFKPNFIIIAVPSIYIEQTLSKFIDILKNRPIIINVAKGLNLKTDKTWSLTIEKIINKKANGLVTLIGPSFAYDVFFKHKTIVNTVSRDIKKAQKVAKIFNNSFFRCVSITDVYGAEIISALKNVMAIGSGIIFSQNHSINTRSAVLAQITKEIFRILTIAGGKNTTLYEFCGIGDIFLTCTDTKSRNFSFGILVGKKGIKNALEQNKNKTVEGYWATKIAYDIIKKHNIDAPVITNIYNILYNNRDAKVFAKEFIKSFR